MGKLYTPHKQTCIVHIFDPLSLRKVWKRLCIFENEATIDCYHGSAIS